jgi:flagellar basal-body rod modification protein FlgD
MDPVSSLGSGGAATSSAPATNAFSSLDTDQFVKIIFTELSNQDPMQPNDSQALLEQLSSLRNIQSGIDLSNKLNTLVAQNEMAAASGLIGHTISGIGEDNQRTQGVVRSVIRTTDGGAVLRLDNNALVRMSNMDQVLSGTGTGGTGSGGNSGGSGGTGATS